MRFVFPLFFLLIAAPVFAADAEVKAKPATAAANPVDALKRSLHKEEKPSPPAPKQNIGWMDLAAETRQEILDQWSDLPETTRPPFPVFRDAQIEKRTSPRLMNEDPETTDDKISPVDSPDNTE